jgi:hypothetical protein
MHDDAAVGPTWTSARVAAWVFAAYVAIALPLLLWMGSYRWFLGDEWGFLTDLSLNFHDMFRPYNQHWATLPLLAYRGLFALVGLRAYWPYQLLVILCHLTIAVLLRVVMRRAGVGPWIATIAAGLFVLFGPGEDNILWALEVQFTSTLVLGLTQLLLADHDGPIDRRDWIGVVVGALALMTSNQALALIAGAGLVCVIRKRWWAAALHTVPLALIYLTWYVATDVPVVVRGTDRPFTVSAYWTWMRDAADGLFNGLGHFAIVAVLLAAVLVGGTALAVRSEGVMAFLRRATVPSVLLLAGIVSMSIAAPSRFDIGEGGAKAGRYVGVMVALTLPGLAVAVDAIARRWRWATPALVVLLLVPVPFNVAAFGDNPVLSRENFALLRNYVATLPANPLVREVPPWVRPNQGLVGTPGMTVGWLLEADRDGKLPAPTGPMNPIVAQTVPIQLGVAPVDGATADGLTCEDHTEPLAVDPTVGDRWYFESTVLIAGRKDGQANTFQSAYPPGGYEIALPDLQLLLTPPLPGSAFRWCR